MSAGELETIELRGMRVWGRHGANPGEQDVPQPIDVDVRLSARVGAARASDALGDTIDYASLHARIARIVAAEHHRLLERLGESVLDAILTDDRVEIATVTVAKPGLLDGATPAVTLSKRRRAT